MATSMAVFRTDSSPHRFLRRVYSHDLGKTWTAPEELPAFSVFPPRCTAVANGTVALVTGRPGLQLWLAADPHAGSWQSVPTSWLTTTSGRPEPGYRISSFRAGRGHGLSKTCSYMATVEVAPNRLLIIYGPRRRKGAQRADRCFPGFFVLPVELLSKVKGVTQHPYPEAPCVSVFCSWRRPAAVLLRLRAAGERRLRPGPPRPSRCDGRNHPFPFPLLVSHHSSPGYGRTPDRHVALPGRIDNYVGPRSRATASRCRRRAGPWTPRHPMGMGAMHMTGAWSEVAGVPMGRSGIGAATRKRRPRAKPDTSPGK